MFLKARFNQKFALFASMFLLAACFAVNSEGVDGCKADELGGKMKAGGPQVASTGTDPNSGPVRQDPKDLDGATSFSGQVPSSTGGPDAFGYQFIDSQESGGPLFSWVDITGTGTLVAGWTSLDDGYAGPFNLGQNFPFYGNTQTQFYAGSNGLITFGAGSGSLSNQCFPDPSTTPNNVIALLWDDLNLNVSGNAYYQFFTSCPVGSGPCTVIEYYNMAHYGGSTGNAGTWEAVLYPSGNILIQFLSAGSELGVSSSTGIEAPAGTSGLSYSCNAANSVADNRAVLYTLPPVGISAVNQNGCPGAVMSYTVTIANRTGADTTFNLGYAGNVWPVSIPATAGPVANGASVDVTVTHTIDPSAVDGAADSFTITAADQANGANTASKTVTTTASLGGSWLTVASSAPSWAGTGYPCRGCTARNASGEWNTYIMGDTSSGGTFAAGPGFWAYNHTTNTWSQSAPSGLPSDRWSPGWAYDSAANLCYMTGGASTPGGGNYNTAYVFNPVANSFTALPSFTSARDFHNSWIGNIDGTKYLCIGGGVDASSTFLSSTQCYNIGTGTWQAENAQMGAYSFGARWGAAEGLVPAATGDQFWVAAGADGSGALTGSAYYFDDLDNAWHAAGSLATPVYRTNGAVSGGDFYVLGGSSGGFTPVANVQRYQGGTWNTLSNMPHTRMDLVAGIGENGYIWVVDGYGATDANYVDYMPFCTTSGCPAITFVPAALPAGTIGMAYSQTVTASGGTAPYTYAVTSGAIPAGLTFNNTSGLLSGTPTAGGTYTFTVTATDSSSCTGNITYTLTVTYGFNWTYYDDSGRSQTCINSTTGYYAWYILSGEGAGNVFIGKAKISQALWGYVITEQTQVTGIRLLVYTNSNKAVGSLSRPAIRTPSHLSDSNLEDDPPCGGSRD